MNLMDDIPIDVLPDEEFYKFAPGTPTLAARELQEKGRQFDASLSETKRNNEANALAEVLALKEKQRQFDMGFGEDQRQFNAKLGEDGRQFNLGYGLKSQGTGGSNGGSLFSAAVNEMLSGQSRYRAATSKGKTVAPHNYNHYVSVAINLAQKNGQSLSASEIKSLQEQAKNMAAQDIAWKKQIDQDN